MEVERIDHIHFKTLNMERDTRLFENLTGKKPLFEADFSEPFGVQVTLFAYPLGFQLMHVTDKDKEQGQIYGDLPEGICAISLKVPDMEKTITEMESMGYRKLYLYDFGQIKEAMFDTRKAFGLFIECIEFSGETVDSLVEETLPRVSGES